ncbi:MAG: recombinase family protein [Bacillota bacterium]|nr:recombinase family protein [Bacillota bacterium]
MNAIYARAHDDEGAELGAQIARCKEQAELQGRHIEPDKIYTDAGGWKMGVNRIGLRQLKIDIDAGRIGAVYVDALDRLGRSLDIKPMVEDWRRKGVSVVTASARK